VTGEVTKSDCYIGFKEEINGNPDCKILWAEHASKRDPEHKLNGEVQVPLGLMCKNKLENYPASTTV
jgi:hypothetical protein